MAQCQGMTDSSSSGSSRSSWASDSRLAARVTAHLQQQQQRMLLPVAKPAEQVLWWMRA